MLVVVEYVLCLALLAGGLIGLYRLAPRVSGPVLLGASAVAATIFATVLAAISKPDVMLIDFFKAYYPAGRTVLRHPDQLEPLLRNCDYVNIPVVSLLFAPLGAFPPPIAGYAFTVLGLGATGIAWWLLVRAARLQTREAAVLLFLFGASGPLAYSLKIGNTTHIVLALVTGAFLLLRQRRDFAAGALLGLVAVVKLPLMLFGVYFLARRRWRSVAGMVAVGAVAGVLSLAIFGWGLNLFWYQHCVAPFSRDPMAAFNVQSIHGALARLERGYGALEDWNPVPLSSLSHHLATALVAILYIAVFVAVWRSLRSARARVAAAETVRELELLLVLTLALIAGPMAWSHYYALLLMPVAFFLGEGDHLPRDRPTRLLAWASIVLAAAPVLQLRSPKAALMTLYARVLVPHYLVAGILLFACLVRARSLIRSTGGANRPSS